ncbi:MAG: hypothetical protein LBE06_00155 [Azoarcus sp.]|jgi:hypothetical protein|nr:hypothetical protein [Azoarcus sp.]
MTQKTDWLPARREMQIDLSKNWQTILTAAKVGARRYLPFHQPAQKTQNRRVQSGSSGYRLAITQNLMLRPCSFRAVSRNYAANVDFKGMHVSPGLKSASDDRWMARNYLRQGRRVGKWFVYAETAPGRYRGDRPDGRRAGLAARTRLTVG